MPSCAGLESSLWNHSLIIDGTAIAFCWRRGFIGPDRRRRQRVRGRIEKEQEMTRSSRCDIRVPSTKVAGIALLGFLLLGCATGGLTRQDVLRHYDSIAELSSGLADADQKEAALLAPAGTEKAHALLDKAVEQAVNAEKTEALKTAKKGLIALDGVIANMALVHDGFSEVLETRARAKMEEADALFEGDFADADDQLRETALMVERGKLPEAANRRPELMALYADLEVKAMKKGTRKAAEAAIEMAEDMDADDHAPKTFERAVQELALVSSVLDADRTNTEKADEHARRAIWLAGQAMTITRLALIFEENDYELEDIVLWHQSQLDEINEPLNQSLPFDESEAAAVMQLRSSIAALLEALDDMRGTSVLQQQRISDLRDDLDAQRASSNEKIKALIAGYQQQIEEWRKQFASMKHASRSELARLQKDAAAKLSETKTAYERELVAQAEAEAEAEQRRKASAKRFEDVRRLFGENEATVSRQGDNILIAAQGFDFPRGSIEIGAKNFGLLDKIVTAINSFPQSSILVTGHTDSSGSKDRNLRLSTERADSVASFLTTVGKVQTSRVRTSGMGEEAPVSSNGSRDGRAKNRRIEVLIVNEPAAI
ncbi:MAG: OmpA family protein [Polyangia bacterium]